MIKLIYGRKGSGKTKRLIDMVNAELESAKGDIVFIDDDKRYMYDVKPQIRFIDLSEYNIKGGDSLYGFICGIMAQNYDIATIYIDAFKKIVGDVDMDAYLQRLEMIAGRNDVTAIINISGDPEDASEYVRSLII